MLIIKQSKKHYVVITEMTSFLIQTLTSKET